MATALEPGEFRRAIGRFATGVTVVTAKGSEGPAGLTTNAFCSLSLEPLLVLVCFDNASRTLPVVREARRFAVNVLASDQDELARVFASKRVAAEKFAAVTHTEAHDVPVLDGVLAWFACDLDALHPAGDHTIGIGAVTRLHARADGDPLIFHGGRFAEVTPPR